MLWVNLYVVQSACELRTIVIVIPLELELMMEDIKTRLELYKKRNQNK